MSTAKAAGAANGTNAPQAPEHAIAPAEFRSVLGHFCTGVTVVTGMDGARPVGFACQSFTALSLDPPLVLFCPGRQSGSWAAIRTSGRFCVNVLAENQRSVSRVFGAPGADRFAGLGWSVSPAGNPVLDGVLTWVDCDIDEVRDGGDHHVVIGAVRELGPTRADQPLLFYQGAYTATDPAAQGGPEPWLAELLTWQPGSGWL